MAAEYIFGHSEAEESENKKLLVDYYKNQPEEFFESWTDDDIAGEGLVERMAKDLLSAKANAPEFDKSDRRKLNIRICMESNFTEQNFYTHIENLIQEMM